MLHLQIFGYTFEGFKAAYQYTPKASAADVMAFPARFAGDFASVIDWRLVEETNEYERTSRPPITRRIDTFKTLRGFRAGMTPRRFDRIINGGAS